jgi:CHASE2 domain-containing sensor protein
VDPPRRKRPRKLFGVNVSDLLAERRRAGVSFAVGLIILLLIQIPAVEQSFLGAPDRQMMEWAFKLRADLTGGKADPVLFLDFDNRTISKLNAAGPYAPPLATVPRGALADLLDFIRAAPAAQEPRAVLFDVDLSQPATDGDQGVEKLKAALAAWGATRSAPPLVLIREAYPATAVGLEGGGLVLPDTPYDAAVLAAPNIRWSEAKVLGDLNAVVRDFQPYECVRTSAGLAPLYAAALIAYQYIESDRAALQNAPARHWFEEAASRCQSGSDPPPGHGEMIDYTLSLDMGPLTHSSPSLDPGWPGFATCGVADSAVLRQLSVIDILQAGGDASRGLLCGHVVIIGGTNASAADFIQTPLNEMNGSIVLANSVRGLLLTHGGLRPIPLPAQVLLLLVVSLAISASAAATSRARRRYLRLRGGPHSETLTHRLAILPLNPIVLNGIIALSAHWLGVALLMVSLNFGLWGFLSAPAFAAAITETIQELTDG